MFGRFCQNNPCFLQQERAQEIEVPPMYHLQQSINQLPPFENHRPTNKYNQNDRSFNSNTHQQPQMTNPRLMKIRSQQDLGLLSLTNKGKENYGATTAKKYNFSGIQHPQQRQKTLRNPLQQDTCNRSHDGFAVYPNTSHIESEYFPQGNSSTMARGGHKGRQSYETESTRSVVSMQEFKRVVNMNLNLIKIIEEDYQPLRESCWSLEQQQMEKAELIDSLEKKVRDLKRQLGSRQLIDPQQRFF